MAAGARVRGLLRRSCLRAISHERWQHTDRLLPPPPTAGTVFTAKPRALHAMPHARLSAMEATVRPEGRQKESSVSSSARKPHMKMDWTPSQKAVATTFWPSDMGVGMAGCPIPKATGSFRVRNIYLHPPALQTPNPTALLAKQERKTASILKKKNE